MYIVQTHIYNKPQQHSSGWRYIHQTYLEPCQEQEQVEQLDGQSTSLENLANGTWVSEIKTFVPIDSKLSALFINLLMFSFSKGFDLKKK